MARNRIRVTSQTGSGRNTGFHDNYTGMDMTRAQFACEIRNGNYEGYHIRMINGLATPVSNPDRSQRNNLG